MKWLNCEYLSAAAELSMELVELGVAVEGSNCRIGIVELTNCLTVELLNC